MDNSDLSGSGFTFFTLGLTWSLPPPPRPVEQNLFFWSIIFFYEFVYQFRATRTTNCPIEFNWTRSFRYVLLGSLSLGESGPLKKCCCLDWRKLTSVRITHKRNWSSGSVQWNAWNCKDVDLHLKSLNINFFLPAVKQENGEPYLLVS